MNRRGERLLLRSTTQDKSKVSSIYKSHGGVTNYHYPNQNMLTRLPPDSNEWHKQESHISPVLSKR